MLNIVNNTTFPNPFDLLFPHSCRGCGRIGSIFCKDCKNYIIKHHQNFCPHCQNPTCQSLSPIYTVGSRDGILGQLIHDYKYHSVRALARPLAELLNASLPPDLPPGSIFVPLPTATNHVRSRGLDHTLLIAKNLSKIRHLPIKKVLLRDKNTVQVGSSRTERIEQAQNAYKLNPKVKISPDATYILIDDVWTTGASILSAKKILEKSGTKNFILAILAYSL